MNDLLIGLLSALVATNTPAAVSNLVQQKTGLKVAVTAVATNDPVELAYQKLMADDDAAQAEVDEWIQARNKLGPQTDVEKAILNGRIKRRFEPVIKGYEDFLNVHTNHANARIAYGSFLNDIGDEDAAHVQWKKATEVDPKNPAAWNNLANAEGHHGDSKIAFEYYAKAMELDPTEPVYIQNLATTVFLFRKDAMEHYRITEQQVFEKAMALYRKAFAMDPENYSMAAELAQTFYGIKTPKFEDTNATRAAEIKLGDEALAAWKTAQKLASNELEREGIHLHFARWQINLGRYAEARTNLASVSNEVWAVTKRNLTKKLESKESGLSITNAPGAASAPESK